jgi:Holliday junction resolvase RusA-like endonuclease
MQFDGLPPSVNNLYNNTPLRMGRKIVIKRTLTPEGKLFKQETLAYLVKRYQPQLRFFKKNVPYLFYYRFITPDLLTKTWPKTAENRYKRFDASNLVKSLEDVVVEACGVDDSNFLTIVCEKRKGLKEETHIWVWSLEEEGCPFHAAAISI